MMITICSIFDDCDVGGNNTKIPLRDVIIEPWIYSRDTLRQQKHDVQIEIEMIRYEIYESVPSIAAAGGVPDTCCVGRFTQCRLCSHSTSVDFWLMDYCNRKKEHAVWKLLR